MESEDWLKKFLDKMEWRKTLPRPESRFATVLGLGTLQAEYARANWPTWARILMVGLFPGLILLFFISGILLLVIGGILFAVLALNMLAIWPGRTPRAWFSGPQ